MLSYDLCNKCIEPTWEMYLDPSEKYIGPPGTLATFHGSISAIGHVTRLNKEPRLSVRIVIWIVPSEDFLSFFANIETAMLAGLNRTPVYLWNWI